VDPPPKEDPAPDIPWEATSAEEEKMREEEEN